MKCTPEIFCCKTFIAAKSTEFSFSYKCELLQNLLEKY